MAAAHTFFPSRGSALSSAGAFWRRWRRIAAGRRRRAFGDLERLRDPAAFARYLDPLRQAKWVVYAKPPFGGAPQVLENLGRYTHRVAISNRRLRKLENGQVSFEWKDYRVKRPDQQIKTMTVSAEEFIRRFLQLRSHGLSSASATTAFWPTVHRAARLKLCRQLLATPSSALLPALLAVTAQRQQCPLCGRKLDRLVIRRPCRRLTVHDQEMCQLAACPLCPLSQSAGEVCSPSAAGQPTSPTQRDCSVSALFFQPQPAPICPSQTYSQALSTPSPSFHAHSSQPGDRTKPICKPVSVCGLVHRAVPSTSAASGRLFLIQIHAQPGLLVAVAQSLELPAESTELGVATLERRIEKSGYKSLNR